jgi:Uma2 family endonuclease
MAMAAPRRFSVLDYLRAENEAETKSEYVNGEVFAMAGTSLTHNDVTYTLLTEIAPQLRGGLCMAYGSDLRIRVDASNLYTYPDISIVCGEPDVDPNDSCAVTNPTVLFEVLSDSTESWDRGGKFAHYRLLPSLREYVLVSQSEPRVERYVRSGDDWILTEFVGLEATFALASLEVKVPLSSIYARVEFAERLGRADPASPGE